MLKGEIMVFEEFHRQDRRAKFKIEISSKEPLWPQWPPILLKTPNQIAGNPLAAGQRKNKILTKMKHTEDNPTLEVLKGQKILFQAGFILGDLRQLIKMLLIEEVTYRQSMRTRQIK